jgi:Mg-chelatase subunit ChlD
LKQLAAAIDRLELSRRGPRDVGVLVSYGTEVRLVVPTGPIARITGAATGTQRDYAGNLGTALAGGVDVAMFELEKTTAARKVLIVIGDGTDTDAKRAGPELARYRQRATASGIAIHAIVYRSWVSTPTSVIEALTPNIVEIQAVVDLPARLASIVQQCCR